MRHFFSRRSAVRSPSEASNSFFQAQTSTMEADAGPFPISPTDGLASVVDTMLRARRNIVVLAGAGISVSSDIPDFRSKGTGLYETLDIASLGLSCAEDLFDLEQFLHDPRPFYRFARNLYPAKDGKGGPQPTPAHRFLALLNERGMLRRIYTQNIDGLEERAGIPSAKVVQTHGGLNHASCLKCKRRVDSANIMEDVWAGRVPKCRKEKASAKKKREQMDQQASSKKEAAAVAASAAVESLSPPPRKRQRRPTRKLSENSFSYADEHGIMGDDDDDARNGADPNICGGVLKPNMIFFGETLPNSVAKRLEKDREKADAIIIMGTSLSVAPMSKVIQYLSPSIPRLLINRNVVKAANQRIRTKDVEEGDGKKGGEEVEEEEDTRDGYVFDACLLGNCDDVSNALVREMDRGINGKSEKESKSTTDGNGEDDETTYRMLCNVQEEYRGADGTIRGLHRHPPGRVFLFPGAAIPKESEGGGDSDSDVSYKEVAQCDGCEQQIEGEIMKCQQCFDFDLCTKCFDSGKVAKHFEGKHTFVKE